MAFAARERYLGYLRALRRAGIAPEPDLTRLGVLTVAQAMAETASLLSLDEPPTAIFSANNRVTVGVVKALGPDLGSVAPLVGFDDLELADTLAVPLTVVAHASRLSEIAAWSYCSSASPMRQLRGCAPTCPRACW